MTNSKKNIFKSVALSAFLLMATVNIKAQSKGEIGIRFMPTFSSFDIKSVNGGVIKGKLTLGYGIGGFVGFNLSPYAGVQVEVIYSSLKQKYVDQNVEQKINLTYVNIPILASFNSGKMKPVNVNVVFGPQIGLKVGSSLVSKAGEGAIIIQPVLNVKKSDIGFAYGAGIDFAMNPAKTFRLGLGFRGVYGLFDISNNSKTTTADSYYILDRTHIKTNSAYVGVSFLF
nr:PorT family protein [Bacteroidota bacterium]